MQGQQNWFDPAFSQLSDTLSLDVRPTETVMLTDSAPHVDALQPVPGDVCNKKVEVTDQASDPDGIALVTINGVDAKVKKKGGSFKMKIDLPVGDSLLTVRATDVLGNSITRQRPLHRPAGCN
jgi:hypothetical protein